MGEEAIGVVDKIGYSRSVGPAKVLLGHHVISLLFGGGIIENSYRCKNTENTYDGHYLDEGESLFF
jgi:hypothetical protein